MTDDLAQGQNLASTSRGPFLAWPVSRREFYRALCVGMLLALTWGIILYGVRVLIMLGSSLIAATAMHMLLLRIVRWRRARVLLFSHTLLSTALLVALARPTWPAWIIAAAAGLLPLVFVAIGGPGRERVHGALAALLIIQYALLPLLNGHLYTVKGDAILARDRLVMGDIRDQHAPAPGVPWSTSRELAGNDAFLATPPAESAARAFDQASAVLLASHPLPMAPVTPQDVSDIDAILQRTFAFDLPGMDLFMSGVAPNRVGATSLIALLFAGLLLAYRHILRPWSVSMFLLSFTAASGLLAFTPPTVGHLGLPVILEVLRHFPAEFLTLLEFLVLNSDAPFVAVFVLALPGAEPLSPRGRRIYLLLAAVLSAALHRLDPVAPAATVLLCLFTPLAPLFDRLFARRSWLNEKSMLRT